MSDKWRQLSWAELHSPAAMEKRHYPFRNYRHAAPIVLFPGCNFLSLYPKTTKALCGLLEEKLGMGVVYDCCSQPVADMGLEDEARAIAQALERRLLDHGVQKVVVACPNCLYRMRAMFERVDVANVYDVLASLDMNVQLDDAPIWQPCPDRKSGEMLQSLAGFLAKEPTRVKGVPCCGLKGWGRIFDAQTADGYACKLAEAGKVRTYCASCVMTVARHGGTDMSHALVELMGTGEDPDVAHTLWNRMRGRRA